MIAINCNSNIRTQEHTYIIVYLLICMPTNEQENKYEEERKYEEGVAGTDLKRKESESKQESKKYTKELNTDLDADEGKRSRDKEINR